MILFLKCALLCEDENSENKLNTFVEDLNEQFGDKSCNCHTNLTWEIGVDLMEDCKFHFHGTNKRNPDCGFFERLYKNEIQQYAIK
jgi:hypothetical protein